MIPIDQTRFGVPGGNCESACLASILELPIDQVPDFVGAVDDGGEWFRRLNGWLAHRGLYAIMIQAPSDWRPPGFHTLGGISPRGGPHAVVAKGFDIVHDPHPSRAGLTVHEDLLIFVPTDPVAHRGSDGSCGLICGHLGECGPVHLPGKDV